MMENLSQAHSPDASCLTCTHAVTQCYIRLYDFDSLVDIIVLLEVPEDDFCILRGRSS
jgi:hypothetical protein